MPGVHQGSRFFLGASIGSPFDKLRVTVGLVQQVVNHPSPSLKKRGPLKPPLRGMKFNEEVSRGEAGSNDSLSRANY